MLIYKTGDLLKSTENIICHQVNEDGIMGGGLAKQIANTYPKVEKQYKKFCELFKVNKDLIGQYVVSNIGEHKYISNCFTQDNFKTNLRAIEIVFRGLLESCKRNNFTIAIPYGYGSNIANGSWTKIQSIFEELSNQYNVPITIYRLPNQKELL